MSSQKEVTVNNHGPKILGIKYDGRGHEASCHIITLPTEPIPNTKWEDTYINHTEYKELVAKYKKLCEEHDELKQHCLELEELLEGYEFFTERQLERAEHENNSF